MRERGRLVLHILCFSSLRSGRERVLCQNCELCLGSRTCQFRESAHSCPFHCVSQRCQPFVAKIMREGAVVTPTPQSPLSPSLLTQEECRQHSAPFGAVEFLFRGNPRLVSSLSRSDSEYLSIFLPSLIPCFASLAQARNQRPCTAEWLLFR